MPIYEYYCDDCGCLTEVIRRIAKRKQPAACKRCGCPADLVVSVPSVYVWNTDRCHTNAVHFGDGRFESKKAYEEHLKKNDIVELGVRAPIKRPHGNRVVGTWR